MPKASSIGLRRRGFEFINPELVDQTTFRKKQKTVTIYMKYIDADW